MRRGRGSPLAGSGLLRQRAMVVCGWEQRECFPTAGGPGAGPAGQAWEGLGLSSSPARPHPPAHPAPHWQHQCTDGETEAWKGSPCPGHTAQPPARAMVTTPLPGPMATRGALTGFAVAGAHLHSRRARGAWAERCAGVPTGREGNGVYFGNVLELCVPVSARRHAVPWT